MRTHRSAALILAAAIIALPAAPATASTDIVFNVAQPLVGHDIGIIIGYEAYAGYVGLWPAGMVALTCAENSTRVFGQELRGVATENRNAASVVGLTIRHVPREDHEPFFGDTLRVVLEIPEYAVQLEQGRKHGWLGVITASLRQVVCATIECARINAASQKTGSRYPKLRFLDVDVQGWEDAADLSATYPLEGVPPVPDRQHGFDETGAKKQEICR
jgi:hypothetical protein